MSACCAAPLHACCGAPHVRVHCIDRDAAAIQLPLPPELSPTHWLSFTPRLPGSNHKFSVTNRLQQLALAGRKHWQANCSCLAQPAATKLQTVSISKIFLSRCCNFFSVPTMSHHSALRYWKPRSTCSSCRTCHPHACCACPSAGCARATMDLLFQALGWSIFNLSPSCLPAFLPMVT